MHRAVKLNGTQHPSSPSARTPSETASTNEDWKTAAAESIRDSGSECSPPTSDLRSAANGNAGLHAASRVPTKDKTASPFSLQAEKHTSTTELSRSGITAEKDDDYLAYQLSSANLRRQSDMTDEGELMTPQASRKRHSIMHSSASVISATPSTVYDELDDLKKRIQRLELVPSPTSVPPHAPLNPKHVPASYRARREVHNSRRLFDIESKSLSTTASPCSEHPLLRALLRKLRMSELDPELVKYLDLAISDALVLASRSTDRLSRSRADSLCRSLTGICLFLQDNSDLVDNSPPRNGLRNDYQDTDISDTYRRNHGSLASTTMPRSSSSRRSLAEILQDRDESSDRMSIAEYDRSASRLSRFIEDRQLNDSGSHGVSYSRFRSKTESPHISASHSIMQPATSHRDPLLRTTRWTSRSHSGSLAGDGSPKERGDSRSSHARSSSRMSTAEVMDRSPVTRDSLYARYQRTPPPHPDPQSGSERGWDRNSQQISRKRS